MSDEIRNYAAEGVLSQDLMALQKAIAVEDANRKARYDFWEKTALDPNLSQAEADRARANAAGAMDIGRDQYGNPITSHSIREGASYHPSWARQKTLSDILDLQSKGEYKPNPETMKPETIKALQQYDAAKKQNLTLGVITPDQRAKNILTMRDLEKVLLGKENFGGVLTGVDGNNPIYNSAKAGYSAPTLPNPKQSLNFEEIVL